MMQDTLTEKRGELVATEAALQEAEAALDADAVVALRAKAGVLRGFIAKLEAEARQAADDATKADAAEWLEGHADRMAQTRKRLVAALDAVRPHVEQALQAIATEATIRAEWDALNDGALVVALRFGLPSPIRPVSPPVTENVAALLSAVDGMRSPPRPRRLTVGAPASATAEQRRELVLRAVAQFVSTHGRSLPREVRALLDRAPISDAERGLHPPPIPSEHEQRETQRMAQAVKETEAALALIPNGSGTFGRGL